MKKYRNVYIKQIDCKVLIVIWLKIISYLIMFLCVLFYCFLIIYISRTYFKITIAFK